MKSLNAAFYEVYGQALAPYGYQRVKGRHPYLAKLVNNEILHIFMLKKEWAPNPYIEFGIYGGIATVYRPRLSLDKSSMINKNWLDSHCDMYYRMHRYDENVDKDMIYAFTFNKESEEEMMEQMSYSLELAQQIMLPELEKVNTLKDCLEYRYIFNGSVRVFLDDIFDHTGYSDNVEGIINLKAYNIGEFKEAQKALCNQWNQYWLYELKRGDSGVTQEICEQHKKTDELYMAEQIEVFEQIVNTPEYMEQAEKVMERRKSNNLELLRKFGFDV